MDLSRKQGFGVPLAAWFKGDFGTFVEDVLGQAVPSALRQREFAATDPIAATGPCKLAPSLRAHDVRAMATRVPSLAQTDGESCSPSMATSRPGVSGGPSSRFPRSLKASSAAGHEVTVFTTNSNLDEDLDVPVDPPNRRGRRRGLVFPPHGMGQEGVPVDSLPVEVDGLSCTCRRWPAGSRSGCRVWTSSTRTSRSCTRHGRPRGLRGGTGSRSSTTNGAFSTPSASQVPLAEEVALHRRL